MFLFFTVIRVAYRHMIIIRATSRSSVIITEVSTKPSIITDIFAGAPHHHVVHHLADHGGIWCHHNHHLGNHFVFNDPPLLSSWCASPHLTSEAICLCPDHQLGPYLGCPSCLLFLITNLKLIRKMESHQKSPLQSSFLTWPAPWLLQVRLSLFLRPNQFLTTQVHSPLAEWSLHPP